VEDWPPDGLPATPPARAWLIAQALLPAESTDSWRRLETLPEEALDGIQRIDCATSRAEAGAVALLLREALETEDRTAALVTLDRALARRVAAELRRWGIEVDDSAGTPLAKTPPGSFLSLLAAAASERLAPLPLLALLKHPLAAGGRDPAAFRADARLLERTLLRGPRPAAGLAGLRAAVDALAEGWEREALTRFVARLELRLGGFATLLEGDALRAPDLIAAHLAAAEALAATAEEKGAERLWAGEAGEQAANFIAELGRAAGRFPSLAGRAYGGFFDALLAGQVSRPRFGRHPRLFIWGPLEARLQHADLVILGGLNEGSWPPEPLSDPWMSRPMRQEFGLPQPERRIGLSAHDFAELAAAPSLLLSRALKSEGTPTVPARWLLRLDSLLRAVGRGPEAIPTGPWLAWQAALDRPDGPAQPLPPPEPRPPVAWRPRRLRVTDIEHWMRDPYAIYARYVLGLRALDALDEDPGAAHRGRFIHDALDRFVATHPDALPADAREQLLALGAEAFGAALERPGVRAFWWPRFERIAAWFVAHEAVRRLGLSATQSEIAGEMTFPAPGGDFILAGRADRIDRLAQGGLAIIDYKTGQPPKAQDVQAGFAPQLPLEAALAEAGGFPGVAAEPVVELAIWRLTGGDPPGEEKPLKGEPVRLAREALMGLKALVAAFDAETTPYAARPRPAHAPRYSDYVHLARVKEWAALGGDIEE
jgi:ATP-dependent helicase/nuclease subunit B